MNNPKIQTTLIGFTIGHSNHEIDLFLNLLINNSINLVIDIRSSPYSKYVPQYNMKNIKSLLLSRSIEYLFLGDELGGKTSNSDLQFPDGKTNYELLKKTDDYIDGIKTVIRKISDGYNIALMCVEKNPFDCHRFVMVSSSLADRNIQVNHILEDGKIVTNKELEDRLLEYYKIDYNQATFLGPPIGREDAIKRALKLRNKEIGKIKTEII